MKKRLEKMFEKYWIEGQRPFSQTSNDPDVQKVVKIISDNDTPHEIADKCLLMFCPVDVIIAWRKRRFFIEKH